MADSHDIRWQKLTGQVGNIAYELTRVQFSQGAPCAHWRPPINAYRCRDGILVCVDLAGVNRSEIDLQVEPRRLVLRGRRPPPEPEPGTNEALQVLAMEIDCGSFEREVLLPSDVDPERTKAEHRNGLLWIHLPFPSQA